MNRAGVFTVTPPYLVFIPRLALRCELAVYYNCGWVQNGPLLTGGPLPCHSVRLHAQLSSGRGSTKLGVALDWLLSIQAWMIGAPPEDHIPSIATGVIHVRGFCIWADLGLVVLCKLHFLL